MQDTGIDLKALRESFGVTQTVFAGHMGMPLRSYQDIENGPNPIRPIHIRAAEMAALQLASDKCRFDLLPEKLQMIVRSFKGQT